MYKIFVIIVFLVLSLPAWLQADFEHETVLTDRVAALVRDVVAHPDEDLVFMLAAKKILIYSPTEQVILDTIPVAKVYDRIAYLKQDRLMLTSSQSEGVEIIRFDRIHPIDLTGRAVAGPVDAKVSIVVFDDYQCPYCAKLEKYIQQLLLQYPEKISYAVKHFPLANHPMAHQGAMAVLAAGKQSKYWQFHRRLLERHDQVSESNILEIARSLDLNLVQFARDRQLEASRQLIREDKENGRAIGVNGTPTVFINGKRVKAFQELNTMIQRELARP